MKIGLAGAGGIGSNVAVNLVRSGIRTLKIVDYDTIEKSNLNRQFYFFDQIGRPKVEMLAHNLKRINPYLEVETIHTRITPENIITIFSDCSVIVEGFDTTPEKKMLLESFAQSKKLVVSANGIAGAESDSIRTRKIGNCFIVGDFVNDCRENYLYSHKVSSVAARMAEIILKHRSDNAGA